jgi:hypothetical protein
LLVRLLLPLKLAKITHYCHRQVKKTISFVRFRQHRSFHENDPSRPWKEAGPTCSGAGAPSLTAGAAQSASHEVGHATSTTADDNGRTTTTMKIGEREHGPGGTSVFPPPGGACGLPRVSQPHRESAAAATGLHHVKPQ